MNNGVLYKAKKHKKIDIKKSLFIIRMLAIALINIAVFYFYVNFKSIMMAFIPLLMRREQKQSLKVL